MSQTVPIVNDGNIVDQAEDAVVSTPSNHSAVLHRSLHVDPLNVVSAKGNYLHLNNDQSIFDASGGAAVACLGHGDDRISTAVMDQMKQVSYCHSLFYGTNAAEELAQLLVESTDGEMARAFIVSSGSEAIEAALKLARQYHLEKPNPEPSRAHFVARLHSYHGTTLGALAAGGHVARRTIYEPLLSTNNSHVSPCFAYRGRRTAATDDDEEEDDATYAARLAAELDAEFQRLGPQNVAAFIAEPVVGAALGCVPPVPGYFAAVRRVCDRHGVLLILDEIMSGTGRVGPAASARFPRPLHAWQDEALVGGVAPDIQTMGKGLGGGYMPVAAMLVHRRVVDVLRRGSGAFSHGQTYQGHPVACRAALEVQRIIRQEDLVANVRRQGGLLGRLLEESVGAHPNVGNVRGQGLFWGIDFVKDKATKEPFETSQGVAWGVHQLGMQTPHNISLYPGSGTADGRRGDHIIISPAYTITEEDVRLIVAKVVAVIEEYFAKM